MAGVLLSAASASQSTINAIRPSASAAPPETRLAVGDDRRERPGDQLTLADQVVDRQREAAVLGADDHDEVVRRWRPCGRTPCAASSSGSTPSSSTSIGLPATERRVCSERRSVRSIRSSGIANGAPETST